MKKKNSYVSIAAAAAVERVKNSCAHCKKYFNFTEVRKKCRKCKRYSILEYFFISHYYLLLPLYFFKLQKCDLHGGLVKFKSLFGLSWFRSLQQRRRSSRRRSISSIVTLTTFLSTTRAGAAVSEAVVTGTVAAAAAAAYTAAIDPSTAGGIRMFSSCGTVEEKAETRRSFFH
jgi:hypothetical protein